MPKEKKGKRSSSKKFNYFIKSQKIDISLPRSFKELVIEGRKIIVVCPHPDDLSISLGATISILSKWNEIQPIIFFTGDGGLGSKSVEERKKEVIKESKILGISQPIFLNLNKNEIKDKDKKEVKKIFEKEKADIVLLPSEKDSHPTHKKAANLAIKNLEKSQLQIFYETPWSLLREFNLISIISKKDLKIKLKAIKSHKSQIERAPYDKIAKALSKFRGGTVPEQKILSYGKNTKPLSNYAMEVFRLENLKGYEN